MVLLVSFRMVFGDNLRSIYNNLHVSIKYISLESNKLSKMLNE